MTFQPGNRLSVGNSGRARADILTQALISQINEVDLADPKRRSKMAKLVDKLIDMGCAGDLAAIEFIWNRAEGPLKAVTELKNAEGDTLRVEFVKRVIVDPEMKTIEGDVVS